jgi:hypothetical protein
MSDLLDAVDGLTLPQRFKQMQDTEVVTVELPPLLMQLDAAIRSSMGGTAAGASAAFESSLINSAALFKLMQISSQVADWCRIRHLMPTRGDTPGNLRLWYVSTLVGDFEPAFYVLKLDEWAGAIRTLLDPPRQKDLPDPCPAEDCGADRWWKNQTEGGLRPLVVYYRLGEPIEKGSAECRACGRKWGIRELKYALEQKA